MKQEYTSANTSIKYKECPKLHKLAVKNRWVTPKTRVLDYGAGKYNQGVEYLAKHGIICKAYDKYNRSIVENSRALEWTYEVVLCSNVLNVIAEKEIRQRVMLQCLTYGHIAYFTCYEAPKGGKTGKDSYQTGFKLSEYLLEAYEIALGAYIYPEGVLRLQLL